MTMQNSIQLPISTEPILPATGTRFGTIMRTFAHNDEMMHRCLGRKDWVRANRFLTANAEILRQLTLRETRD